MVREGLTLSTDCLLSILKPVHVLIMQAHTCRSFSNQKCTQVLGSVNYRSPHRLPRKVSPSSARPSFTTTHLPAPQTIPLSSLTIPLLSPLAQLVMSQILSFHSWKLLFPTPLLFLSTNNSDSNVNNSNKILHKPTAAVSSLPPPLLVQRDKGLQGLNLHELKSLGSPPA